ncbi:MAG: hypothetical protein II401_03315 [Bacteroidales bacterium]|nr:hypothetical protein [Bacteroidales bacterium]
MLPGLAKIIKCPFCGSNIELFTMRSGNTCGATFWSDQKMIAPMLPRVSPVQKCPSCGKYYLEYKQPYKEGDHESFNLGELSYQEWKEAYIQLQSDNNITKDDFQIIRCRIIHAYNDNYNRGKELSIPAEEEAFFSDIIHELIDSHKWEEKDLLFKAELYREAGDMEKCSEVLSKISLGKHDDYKKSLINTIRTKMEKGDKKVFRLN